MRSMRWVISALVVLALPSGALADEFNILRGTVPTYHWGGFYGGGQAGYASSNVNFGTAPSSEVAFLLRDTAIEQDEQISDWTVLDSRKPVSVSLGGFLGYNYEWEDNIVLGLELNYNHVFLSASATNGIERSFTDSSDLPAGHNYFYTVGVAGTASLKMTDIGTFRARAGLEEGIFLPYAFTGLALARADTTTGAAVEYTAVDYPDSETPPLTPLPNLNVGPLGQTNAQNNVFAYGVTAGVGVDVAVTQNLFMRGELEYIYFAPVNGIQVSIATARLGAGVKF
jgi:outer membrane immunogenic protein